MILKNDYPILEHTSESEAVINPWRDDSFTLPRLCLMTFFEEVLDSAVEKYNGIKLATYYSETKRINVYSIEHDGTQLCIIQAVVGSAAISTMTDWLYAHGVEVIICCGCCGVLDDIPAGSVIIPMRALRDEGASYKYLPPSRYVELQSSPIEVIKRVLNDRGVHYIECMTWSTDGFFRETKEMVEYRKSEGCRVVEMECAAMAAVAQFRGKVFAQLLYSGDILVNEKYDDRDWYSNLSAREKIFCLALDVLCEF